jgi:hypothetical protein
LNFVTLCCRVFPPKMFSSRLLQNTTSDLAIVHTR